MAGTERSVGTVQEREPFTEGTSEATRRLLYRHLASLRGQYEQDPSYKDEATRVNNFLLTASQMVQLGLEVPVSTKDEEDIRNNWEKIDDPFSTIPLRARHLGIKVVLDKQLIDAYSRMLEEARTDVDKYPGYFLSNLLVDLKFLGVDAATTRDIQVIGDDTSSLRREGGWISVGRLLPVIAANSKLLGMDFRASPGEWSLMKQELDDERGLAKDGSKDGMFWYLGGLINLSVIDSQSPKIEKGKIVY